MSSGGGGSYVLSEQCPQRFFCSLPALLLSTPHVFASSPALIAQAAAVDDYTNPLTVEVQNKIEHTQRKGLGFPNIFEPLPPPTPQLLCVCSGSHHKSWSRPTFHPRRMRATIRMNLDIIANFSKQSDPLQQKAVFEYFESLKNNPFGWKLCAETLLADSIKDESAIFFCFQVIEDYIKTRYPVDSEEHRQALNHLVLSLFEQDLFTSNFLQNKYAHLVNAIFLADYPAQKWNSFFKDFLGRCDGRSKCDIFLRILTQINLDIADRDIPRTNKEMQRNTVIRDAMRETCLLDLAQFWLHIINTYRETSPPTVCLCLDVIGAYVSWIDINLITNDSVMSNLFSLFTSELFRSAVTDCFNAILRKGMDPFAKTAIIENFISIDFIKATLREVFVQPTTTEDSLEFVSKFAQLINTIGTELIEAYRKVKGKTGGSTSSASAASTSAVTSNGSEVQALSVISAAIEGKFSLLCQCLAHAELAVAQRVHSFARDYIQWIKKESEKDGGALCENNNSQSGELLNEKTAILLSIIIEKSKYPLAVSELLLLSSSDLNNEPHGGGSETTEFFEEFRKSTKVLFDNLLLLNPATTVAFVCDKIVAPTLLNWKSRSLPFADIEVALYYFYLLGENINQIGGGGGGGGGNPLTGGNIDAKQLESLVQLLVSSSISAYPNPVTQAFYFDLVFRYASLLNSSLSYLSSAILISFLDERGLRNSNRRIRSKVARLFNKFIKSYIRANKGQEKPTTATAFTEDILKRLQDFLKLEATYDTAEYLAELGLVEQLGHSSYLVSAEAAERNGFPWALSLADQLAVYETVTFLIIGSTHYEPARKRELLENGVFAPVWEAFETRYQEALSLGAALTKNGFLGGGRAAKSSLVEQRLLSAYRLAHCIHLVSATSRAFSSAVPVKSVEGLQELYLRSFELFLKTMALAEEGGGGGSGSSSEDDGSTETLHLLQAAIRLLLHRLIVCIDEEAMIPILPNAIQRTFLSAADITAKSLQELVPLFSQILPKYRHSWLFARDIVPFVGRIFSPLVLLFFKLIYAAANSVGVGGDAEALQKAYFTFVNIVVMNNLILAFFDLDTQLIEQVLGSLLEAAVNFPDGSVQRMCYQTVGKLVEIYGNDLQLPEKQNRPSNALFIAFIHKSLVLGCLVGAARRAADDYPTTMEAVLVLRKLNALLPDDQLAAYLRTDLLPKHFPAPETGAWDQLLALLLLADLKGSRKALRAALQASNLPDAT